MLRRQQSRIAIKALYTSAGRRGRQRAARGSHESPWYASPVRARRRPPGPFQASITVKWFVRAFWCTTSKRRLPDSFRLESASALRATAALSRFGGPTSTCVTTRMAPGPCIGGSGATEVATQRRSSTGAIRSGVNSRVLHRYSLRHIGLNPWHPARAGTTQRQAAGRQSPT